MRGLYQYLTEEEKERVNEYSDYINNTKRTESFHYRSMMIGNFILEEFRKGGHKIIVEPAEDTWIKD